MLGPRMGRSRTRMRDIAEACKVSEATVSLALRNDPRISRETRTRIWAKAKELNYSKDHLASRHAVYVRSAGERKLALNLAFVVEEPVARLQSSHSYFYEEYLGARERAEELGCAIDSFPLTEYGFKLAKLRPILESRGITGIVLGPSTRAASFEGFAMDHFSLATIGYREETKRLSRVDHDNFHGALSLLRTLSERGYRRIGFVSAHYSADNLRNMPLAAYLLDANRFESADRLPPLLLSRELEPRRREITRWIEKAAPDCIVSDHPTLVESAASDMGLKVPGEVAIASLSWRPECGHISGWNKQPKRQGAEAANLVIGQIFRQEYGPPLRPRVVLLQGQWEEGETA